MSYCLYYFPNKSQTFIIIKQLIDIHYHSKAFDHLIEKNRYAWNNFKLSMNMWSIIFKTKINAYDSKSRYLWIIMFQYIILLRIGKSFRNFTLTGITSNKNSLAICLRPIPFISICITISIKFRKYECGFFNYKFFQ